MPEPIERRAGRRIFWVRRGPELEVRDGLATQADRSEEEPEVVADLEVRRDLERGAPVRTQRRTDAPSGDGLAGLAQA